MTGPPVSTLPEAAQTFPGRPESIGSLRRFIASSLPVDFGNVDAAVLTGVELATNSLLHSRSGAPDGSFAVKIAIYPGVKAHLEVWDQGPLDGTCHSATGRPASDDIPADGTALPTGGRGLTLIMALATELGEDTTPAGHLAWADIPWHTTHVDDASRRRTG